MASVTELTRKEYWIRMIFLYAELMLVSAVLYIVADLQNAELPGASAVQQWVAIIAFGLMILNAIVVYVVTLLAILRRARSTGLTVPLFLLGALVPFGWIIVGIVPTRK